jgi:hypothetical protein
MYRCCLSAAIAGCLLLLFLFLLEMLLLLMFGFLLLLLLLLWAACLKPSQALAESRPSLFRLRFIGLDF